MSSATETRPVDLAAYEIHPECEHCGGPATHVGQGCMDRTEVMLCEPCLEAAMQLIRTVVKLFQRRHRRIMVCGDCYRPILSLETHMSIQRIAP